MSGNISGRDGKKSNIFLAEQRKLRTRYVWLVPAGFLGVLFLWTLTVILNFREDDWETGYQYLLYSMSMMNAIFLPVMLSVVASRLCDMEIKGNTLKLLFTMERPGRFYDIKYLFELRYLLIFSAGETLGLILMGKAAGVTEAVRPLIFLEHFVSVTAVGAVILSIQHLLSLMSENQLLPLIVGIAGGFLGLFSMFFPEIVNRLILWGYFSIFAVAGVDWQRSTDEVVYLYYRPLPAAEFAAFLVAGAVIYLAGKQIFLRKEV